MFHQIVELQVGLRLDQNMDGAAARRSCDASSQYADAPETLQAGHGPVAIAWQHASEAVRARPHSPGRCRVTTKYWPAQAQLSPKRRTFAAGPYGPAGCRSSCCRQRRYALRPTPRPRRFSLANSLVVKNQLVMASVTIRLISSGMVQSPDRMPAFDMRYPYAQLLGRDRARHGGGNIPHHQTERRRAVQQQLLVAAS